MKRRAHRLTGALIGCSALLALGALAANRGLLVGIDHYDPAYGAGSLPSCINDATGFRAKLLADPSRWGDPLITVLTDSAATKSQIAAKIASIAAASSSGDVFVYFHSSHGGQYSGTSTYLCTYAADFTDTELGTALAAFSSGVKVIVVVDACHSGGLFKNSAGVYTIPPWPFIENTVAACQQAKAKSLGITDAEVSKELAANIAFMTACDYDQTCSAGNPYSLYAGYVIEAFGNPTADSNSDGNYTFYELNSYAAPKATRVNPNQTAQSYHESVLQSVVAAGSGGGEVGPLIKANGSSSDILISQSANLLLTVQLNPGPYQGVAADWWVVALAGSSWLYLNNAMLWKVFDGNLANCHPAYQGGLVTLPATPIVNMSGLPRGSYTFWFAVDSPKDGILNLNGSIVIDSLNVIVQ